MPGAFAADETLIPVDIPDTVTVIGRSAFASCQKLTTVRFPPKPERLASKAFSCCTRLSEPRLPDTLSEIGTMAFAMCKGMTHFCVPASIKVSASYTFYDAAVQTIEFAANSRLLTLAESAFAESTLRRITVPASVKNVTDVSFAYCRQLQYVWFEGDAPADYGAYTGGVNFIICYHKDAHGFTSPEWHGHRTEIR